MYKKYMRRSFFRFISLKKLNYTTGMYAYNDYFLVYIRPSKVWGTLRLPENTYT